MSPAASSFSLASDNVDLRFSSFLLRDWEGELRQRGQTQEFRRIHSRQDVTRGETLTSSGSVSSLATGP